jgi:hypothetical protein
MLGLSGAEDFDHLLDMGEFGDVRGEVLGRETMVFDRGHLVEQRSQLAHSCPLISSNIRSIYDRFKRVVTQPSRISQNERDCRFPDARKMGLWPLARRSNRASDGIGAVRLGLL